MINASLTKATNDILRNKLLNLEKCLDSDVFTYYGEISNGIEAPVKDIIESLVSSDGCRSKLAVILTTPGGGLLAVERMAQIFRYHYEEVNFIVPDQAFSAGTILCMSGDNIFMNYYSVLGPIDPQVPNKEGKYVGALGYLDKIAELLEKAQNHTITDAEFMILKDFDLAELREYEQSKEIAVDMLKKWLAQYKFKDWVTHSSTGQKVTDADKIQRAEEIAVALSDNKKWKSHSRPIHMHTLVAELKLQIVDIDDVENLSVLLTDYQECIEEYTRNTEQSIFIQTRLWV